jgi:hypothetical protein
MKSTLLTGVGVATVAALGLSAPAMADDMVEDKLATMEQRIKHLEERVASQDQMIVEKEGEMAAMSDGWFNSVSVFGVVELELASESPAGEEGTTSAGVATMELGAAAALNDEWGVEVLLEEDDGIKLADAFLTYEPGEGFSVAMGQQTLPFGVYDTNLVSDPLTKVLGETAHTSLVLSGEAAQFGWSFLTYHDGGDTLDGFGIGLGTAMEGDDSSFGVDVAWISDIGDSDGLSEQFEDDVLGMSASARGSVGPVSAIVEFVTALDSGGGGAEPSAWHAEAAYGFDLMGREAVLAVGAGGTSDAADAELAETLMLLGISVGVAEGVGLGIEWSQREGYDSGGADDAITALLAAEF